MSTPDRQARPGRILLHHEVCTRCGLSPSQIRRLENTGDFPPRGKFGHRTIGWPEDEIDAWVARRLAERKVKPRLADELPPAAA